ncbi:MAG: sensor histidine kinase [Nitrospiraceae bacterium]|nr:sensor histidine kinase [Nitrospiraceae bacterium]
MLELAVPAKSSPARRVRFTRSAAEVLLGRLKTVNLWHMLWVSLILSEIFTTAMNILMSRLWWGRISRNLILIGSVDGFVVALLVSAIVIAFVIEIREHEKHAEKELLKNEQVYRQRVEVSLKEKEALLHELYHRTKNNMQLVSSLLSLQTDSITDERVSGMLRDTQARIEAISSINEQMYESKDLANIDIKDYVEVMANVLLLGYRGREDNITLELDVDSISMSIDIVMPCGLILNELISNSVKYAFPEGRAGIIGISLRVNGNQVELVYRDNGIGLPSSGIESAKSTGLRLVNNLVTRHLGGKLEAGSGGKTEFLITFKKEIDSFSRQAFF